MILLGVGDHRRSRTDSLAKAFYKPRQQHLACCKMPKVLRGPVFSKAKGYRAEDDADLMAYDPTLRMATWDRSDERVLD